MSKIKGKDTLPEVVFRKKLYSMSIRYRLNHKLPGKPDLVIPSKRTVIFIHGCFWHQHKNCRLAYIPKSNIDFWQNKFEKNKAGFTRLFLLP
jgi:DNA mismatch endonuclease, patch repair protein